MTTVLICEDDPLLATDLAQIVEDAGHDVTAIYARADDLLSSAELPDAEVAIIDLHLGDGDTGTLVAQLLQSAGMRIIVLSGHTNLNTGLCSIPHTYAPKPVSAEVVQGLLAIGPSQATA